MSCNEIDSIFENENNDLHNDTLLSDKLWNGDDLSITSNDMDWDTLIYDDILDHSFDQISEKCKEKYFSDFDYNISELTDVFKSTAKNSVKVESTNSVTSSYMTDDCSPTSSYNNSPIVKKIKKENIKISTDYSSSEKSPLLLDYDNESIMNKESRRSPKSEKTNEIMYQNPPRTIYKLSRNLKIDKTREPIIIGNVSNNQRQILKIRQAPVTSTPCIIPGSIKSLNISRNVYHNKPANENLSNKSQILLKSSISKNNHYYPEIIEEDYDLLSGEYYDQEFDLQSDCKPRVGTYLNHNLTHTSNIQPIPSSCSLFQTPIPQTGPFYLTEEEKRTLRQENYPIPTRLPLTKQEERNLKKVRRKIKNKLSAQESRRKKKEYVDALEKKVEAYEHELVDNKKRIEMLEHQQKTLQNQIRHYQNIVMNKISGTASTASTGLMLFVICFALILVGGSMSSTSRYMNSPQSSLVSGLSIYYMGYGPSRNMVNNSQDLSLHRINVKNQLNRYINKSDEVHYIIPRQSILLDEDNGKRNIDMDDEEKEVVSNCRKCNNKILRSVIHSNNLTTKDNNRKWFRYSNDERMAESDDIIAPYLYHRSS